MEKVLTYKINKHNSTVCGYPGRIYDWSKFDWQGRETHTFSNGKIIKAQKPYTDNGLIAENCEYLHVPYDFAAVGTTYRVRPNECMYAGKVYRNRKVIQQRAVEIKGVWYWLLITESLAN